jgi:hypothetical protein
MSTTQQLPPLSHEQARLNEHTVKETMRQQVQDLLMGALDSLDPSQINPKTYWPTALKALSVGARKSATMGEFITQISRILEVESWGKAPCNSACSIAADVEARGHWSVMRQLVIDEADYLILLVRVRREQRKAPYQLGE